MESSLHYLHFLGIHNMSGSVLSLSMGVKDDEELATKWVRQTQVAFPKGISSCSLGHSFTKIFIVYSYSGWHWDGQEGCQFKIFSAICGEQRHLEMF